MAEENYYVYSLSCTIEISSVDGELSKATIHRCTLIKSPSFELQNIYGSDTKAVFISNDAVPGMAIKLELTETQLTLFAANPNNVELWKEILNEKYTNEEKSWSAEEKCDLTDIPNFNAWEIVGEYVRSNLFTLTLGVVALGYVFRNYLFER